MVPTLLITALQAISNCVIIMFSCYGLGVYGAWLHKYHNNDLWLIRILVQKLFFFYYSPRTLYCVNKPSTSVPDSYVLVTDMCCLFMVSILWSLGFSRTGAVLIWAPYWLTLLQVQNGVALYATWWAVATFLHLTVVLDHQTPIPKTDAAIMVLVLLQLGLIGWWDFDPTFDLTS